MGKPIFMIHGMWGAGWHWDRYREYFEARGYRCLAPTLRYHDMKPGDSPDPRLGAVSLLDYAEDLELEIRGLNEKPVLMGHSMGGLLAQILGSRGLAEALILLTPASPRGILAMTPSVLKSFSGLMLRWGFWRKPNRISFAAAVYALFHLVPADEQRALYDRLVYESGRAATEIGLWIFDPTRASQVDGSKINCPVLVVAGAEDRITPASVVRQVARKYGAVSTYKEFPGQAHWRLGQPGWEEVAAYAAEWIAQQTG
jgi:pimeloyl-ACP methyl ester carboxylesterase